MKKPFILLCFTAGFIFNCQAATDLTATLSGDPIYYGQGTFSLEGNTLSYVLRTDPYGFRFAAIHGPADLNQTGPVLYSLRVTGCYAPGGDSFGHCDFGGMLSITDAEALDLQNGFWYVNSMSDNPARFIRGQITAVPEPSTWALAFVGAGAGWLAFRGKRT